MKRFLIFSIVLLMPLIMMGSMVINDVSPSSDLYPYVVEMVQDNIMSLDSNNDFNGSLVVTRSCTDSLESFELPSGKNPACCPNLTANRSGNICLT